LARVGTDRGFGIGDDGCYPGVGAEPARRQYRFRRRPAQGDAPDVAGDLRRVETRWDPRVGRYAADVPRRDGRRGPGHRRDRNRIADQWDDGRGGSDDGGEWVDGL